MDSLRRHRRWLPAWLAPLLLFAQIATSAYACPQAAPLVEAPAAMAQMPDCHAAMDTAQPQLCKAHCEAGQQSVNSNAGAASVPAPALIDTRWMRAWLGVETARATRVPAQVSLPGAPAGAPPIYLALLVLRN